ncbi:hypothetical protein ACELLULO517_07605 [Acidisoma cellulosilytica]|uniref:GcrA cell cycle regulator n=1 Tax=Acidisoma cellulosilyticum TaxID=2802395 RepID=A0A964E354_9PROT|nr:GcrA family cell cycle regulator [Acidisoma cellulosilyticum]MCB8880096.1 hypothetical protein [Acidisoma cellulosilyticum]
MIGNPLSAEEESVIRTEWAAGTSMQDIADRVGRTKNSVSGHIHRMGLPARPSPIRTSSAPRATTRKPLPVQFIGEAISPPTHFAPIAAGKCQWLEGRPRDLNFCHAPTVPGRSWCCAHLARVYVQSVPKGADLAA